MSYETLNGCSFVENVRDILIKSLKERSCSDITPRDSLDMLFYVYFRDFPEGASFLFNRIETKTGITIENILLYNGIIPHFDLISYVQEYPDSVPKLIECVSCMVSSVEVVS